MKIDVEVKIKLEKGKQISLKNQDARELYEKLKEIYEKKEINWYPYYPTTYPTYPTVTYKTTSGCATIITNEEN
jgi:hypothetical protein